MKKETKEKLERALLQFFLSVALLIIVRVIQERIDSNLFLEMIIITLTVLAGYLITKLYGDRIIEFVKNNSLKIIFVIILFIIIGYYIYFC